MACRSDTKSGAAARQFRIRSRVGSATVSRRSAAEFVVVVIFAWTNIGGGGRGGRGGKGGKGGRSGKGGSGRRCPQRGRILPRRSPIQASIEPPSQSSGSASEFVDRTVLFIVQDPPISAE